MTMVGEYLEQARNASRSEGLAKDFQLSLCPDSSQQNKMYEIAGN
jgi:hypothetical protein